MVVDMTIDGGADSAHSNEALDIVDLRDGDCGPLSLYFSSLTAGSRYNRFLGAIADAQPLIQRLLATGRLANRWITAKRDGQIVGEAIVAFNAPARCAEFAVSVSDSLRQSGIGSMLLAALERIAVERGATHLVGDVLSTNSVMLRFAERNGFVQQRKSRDWALKLIEKQLILLR